MYNQKNNDSERCTNIDMFLRKRYTNVKDKKYYNYNRLKYKVID